MSDDADPQASDALAEQRVVVRYRLVRWRSADNEVGPFRADTIFAALRLIRLERDGVRFAADSLVERDGFEPSVPRRRPSAPRQLNLLHPWNFPGALIPPEQCRNPQKKLKSYRRLQRKKVRSRQRDKRSRDTDPPEPGQRDPVPHAKNQRTPENRDCRAA